MEFEVKWQTGGEIERLNKRFHRGFNFAAVDHDLKLISPVKVNFPNAKRIFSPKVVR